MSRFLPPRPWLALAALLILLVAAGPVPVAAQTRKQSIRYLDLNKVRYLYLKDVARFYGMNCHTADKQTVLSSRYSRLVLEQDSRLFQLNGVKANLSFPIAKKGSDMLLAQTDFQDFIDPILRPATIPKRKVRHIMLDPGHGGKDTGAISAKVAEKNINLLLSRRIAAILRKRGYKVTMTRTSDQTLTLQQRVAAMKKYQPDLFLSIHCNALDNSSAKGIETYIANPAGTPSSGGNVFAKKAAPGNAFNRENALLASLLQNQLLAASKAVDCGIKRKQFYVIREVSCPAALLELGFLSNAEERQLLLQSMYQDKLSVAVCDAVQKFEQTLAPVQK
ncbi:MAG: N-acetylmuramoyl-L-alanine amidase [Lentisphaerae bacterium]|nr:N-acetylmuramoyl-L-alanine amidase [Lentisphaerota bacterium]